MSKTKKFPFVIYNRSVYNKGGTKGEQKGEYK